MTLFKAGHNDAICNDYKITGTLCNEYKNCYVTYTMQRNLCLYIQKQLDPSLTRQIHSFCPLYTYSTFCASYDRSLKLLAIYLKNGSSCMRGTNQLTVLKERSFAFEDSFSKEIKFLLKERTWLEEREQPRSVECRLSVIIKNCNYITYNNIQMLNFDKTQKVTFFPQKYHLSMVFLHSFIIFFLMFTFIIKLMQKQFRMERQVPYLSQQDFKKLFPQQYFTKYAEHLNILKFQETIFKDPRPKAEKQFTDRSKRTASQGNLRQLGKVKLNKYDPVGDTIAKNKVEALRMQKFVRVLDHKLKAGPSKTAMTIRTPLQGYNEVPPEVLDKMRFIQNEQYSKEMQLLREKRKAEDEFVHFTVRNRSTSPSKLSMMSRSIMADSVESRSIAEKEQFTINLSNTMQLHPVDVPTSKESSQNAPQGSQSLTYHQRLTKLMAQARSEVTQLNPESRGADVRYIMAMNRSIRKINTLKDEIRSERRKRTVAEWKAQAVLKAHVQPEKEEKKRKNLIAMTQEIRKEGERIELLSRFQELVRERQFKEFLMLKENGSTDAAGKQGST